MTTSEDATDWRENNLPHPAATGRHNFAVRASLVSILKETILDGNHRRVVAKFIDSREQPAEQVNLYDSTQKLGLHLAQTGRISIVYLDECIFKVVKTSRWTRKKRPVRIIKIDLEHVKLTPTHMSALQEVVSRYL